MKCNVTTQKDCEEKYFPFTVMKTDAVKTKNECCPNYCDCPDVCVDEFDQSEHDSKNGTGRLQKCLRLQVFLQIQALRIDEESWQVT